MKSKNPHRSGAAALVVARLAIAGCGGSSSSSTSASGTAATDTMTKEQAAHTYLAAVATPNEVLRTFLAKANGWTDSTPPTQAAADAKPLIDAITTLRTKLQALATAFPPAATDPKAVITAQALLPGDLASLEAVNALNASFFRADGHQGCQRPKSSHRDRALAAWPAAATDLARISEAQQNDPVP